jgi:hypothetical protein
MKKISIKERDKLIIENFWKVTKKLNENERVASDGGYYSDHNSGTHITRDEYKFLIQSGENVFNGLTKNMDDGYYSSNSPYEKKILHNLEGYGLLFSDDDEGQVYYWLKPEITPEELKDEMDGIVHSMYDRVIGESESISETNYDLVSQFNGNHNGNPMGKNAFLNSLRLDENQMMILQDIVNLMTSDSSWVNDVFPDGIDLNALILGIDNHFDNLGAALLYMKSNPMKYANNLKASIKRKKQG